MLIDEQRGSSSIFFQVMISKEQANLLPKSSRSILLGSRSIINRLSNIPNDFQAI